MNKNKKIVLMLLLIISILAVTISFGISVFKKQDNNIDIDKILKTESYEYLPEVAKKYIKQVYEETGTLLLTVKNKQKNVPYLNPAYVDYLTSTTNNETGEIVNEENQTYDVIPSDTVLEYITPEEPTSTELPSKFDLRNVDGKNFVTPLKNQKSTGLCAFFTTNAQAESHLLVKNNTPYQKGVSQIFSEMQTDYATASNGIIDGVSMYKHTRLLGTGARFEYITDVMADGLGLVDVSWKNFDDYDYQPLEKNVVYRLSNTNYEVTSTINYPTLNLSELDLTKEEDLNKKNSYINTLKQIIMENGGAYVGTVAPDRSCSFTANEYRTIYRDDKCNTSSGHAMQIIGWDDDFEYSFCTVQNSDSTYLHYESTSSKCQNETITSGKGAWLLKNSWGTSSMSYVYLAYDSKVADINIITGIENKDWDNFYRLTQNSQLISTYNKNTVVPEKVNSIKIVTKTQQNQYEICINKTTEETKYCKNITTDFPGIYTIDFLEDNIIIDSNINIEINTYNSGSIDKDIKLYTNNVGEDRQVITEDATFEPLLSQIDKYVFRISSQTINIPEKTTVSYKILDQSGNEITTKYSYSENIVFANQIFSKIVIESGLQKGIYTLQTIIDNEVMSSSKIIIASDLFKMEGSGTKEDPYIINTPSHLNLIRLDRFAYYELGQDIDLTYDTQNANGQFYNEGKGWEPIRYFDFKENPHGYVNVGFSGGLDGKNHKIIGLYINRPTEMVIGLFSSIHNQNDAHVYIKNINLVNPQINGYYNVGGLVGYVDGITKEKILNINNIQTIGGTITGNHDVGGIIGYAKMGSNLIDSETSILSHEISNLYNSASVNMHNSIPVTSNNYAGGIIGKLESFKNDSENSPTVTISNISNQGSVISNGKAGGLVGYIMTNNNSNINITNAINTGIVSGTTNSNEILGELHILSTGNLNLTNIYYLNDNDLNYNEKTTIKNVGKKSLSEIKDNNSYSDWPSFDELWKIETIDNIKRIPVLKTVNMEYTSIENIEIKVDETVNIYSLISPKITAAQNIHYALSDSSIATIDEEGNITGILHGETVLHLVSYYDGYEKNVKIKVLGEKNTITFESNGGTSISSITDYIGNKITPPSQPTKEGYQFMGWYEDNGTFEKKYEFNVMPEKNITLYAKWISLNITVNNYKTNDGKISDIEKNSTIENYLKNFEYDQSFTIEFYNHENKLIDDKTSKVGTGSKIQFYNAGNLIEEYTNVVKGDIDGDGETTKNDIIMSTKHILKGNIINGAEFLDAADVDNNGKVGINDIIKLVKSIVANN